MRISDWSSDVCSSDLKEFDEARFENAMRAVVGEVAEVGGSRVTVPWGVPAEAFEDRAEVLASDALQRAGLPGDGADFGLMPPRRPGRSVRLKPPAPVWHPGPPPTPGRPAPAPPPPPPP